MAKWTIFGLIALTIIGYLSAKPLDAAETGAIYLPDNKQQDFQVMADATNLDEEPLIRQKRQRQYWNAVYSPYEYFKKRKTSNRRFFKSTTQRYSVWDLS